MKQLQEAFDSLLPTEAQKEKMLCEIERLCSCKYYQIKTNTKNETVYGFLKKCGYIETDPQKNLTVFQKNKI